MPTTQNLQQQRKAEVLELGAGSSFIAADNVERRPFEEGHGCESRVRFENNMRSDKPSVTKPVSRTEVVQRRS